ncbi:TIGR02300 family protein [Methylovirgula sp. 4M-Z18]|uniref:TIGR02300 family protein n=1 Tax=Methylovirgula sp. 4M-Z18 TaxID=2293567 RepID=UPI000E2E4E55|nr:TIGR02300 family protein [Methylovirgula sp. 4M-Z18]RFB75524.1 TIGR02300 family protein [Methylovirgula sp. 4M-Z18]
MAKPELGMKHQCQNCGTKFFDLNRTPIVCPKCGTVFQAVPLPRSPQRQTTAADDDDTPANPANVELVSMEEADKDAEKVTLVEDDELEIEDDGADDTFLEEEEEDSDDVSDLIDGDIDDEEEA